MTLTLAQLRDRVRRRSNDPEGRLWKDDLVDDAINEALLALGDYSGKLAQHTFTSSADDTESFELPSDFLRLVKVVPPVHSSAGGATTPYLDEYRPEPGEYHYDADDYSAPTGYYILDDDIYFPQGVDDGETVDIVYEALWPAVSADSDEIDLPFWAERAVGYYAIYYCLQLDGVKAAREGFSKTQYESGRPTDNPGLQSASWFFEQFEAICTRNMRKGD